MFELLFFCFPFLSLYVESFSLHQAVDKALANEIVILILCLLHYNGA